MTTDRLRELLHDRVADAPTVDLSERAWAEAVRVRRGRYAVGAGVGSIAAVAAVALGSHVLAPGAGPQPAPAPAPGTSQGRPTPTDPVPTGDTRPDARFDGASVWLGPPAESEADLPPWTGGGLPGDIDLSRPTLEAGGTDPATGVFAIGDDHGVDRVVVLSFAQTFDLDISRLDPVSDEGGNQLSPLTSQGLSPDGTKIFFVQADSLEIYDLAQGWWTRAQTPRFLAESARWVPDPRAGGNPAYALWVPDRVGADSGPGTVYGVNGDRLGRDTLPTRDVWPGHSAQIGSAIQEHDGASAQLFWFDDPLRKIGSEVSLEAVAVAAGGDRSMLVFPAGAGRSKLCCPVVGWLDDGVVAFDSRSDQPRLLAWEVGTDLVYDAGRYIGLGPGEYLYADSWVLPPPHHR